ALLKMAGHRHIYRPREQAILAHQVNHTATRTEFQRVVLKRRADGRLLASTTGSQGSGRLLSMVGANGLIVLPHGQGDFQAGTVVETVILGPVEMETA
ncbi:MAG TPA: molybdopterin molybdenumtransferase MoeA, partial [Anaerolineae bacterium]